MEINAGKAFISINKIKFQLVFYGFKGGHKVGHIGKMGGQEGYVRGEYNKTYCIKFSKIVNYFKEILMMTLCLSSFLSQPTSLSFYIQNICPLS